MGDIITIAAARDHLRVGSETTDAQLEPLIAAAEQALSDWLGRPLIDPLGWVDATAVPANVVHAAKLILSDLFDNRATPIADMTSVKNLAGRYLVVSFG